MFLSLSLLHTSIQHLCDTEEAPGESGDTSCIIALLPVLRADGSHVTNSEKTPCPEILSSNRGANFLVYLGWKYALQ